MAIQLHSVKNSLCGDRQGDALGDCALPLRISTTLQTHHPLVVNGGDGAGTQMCKVMLITDRFIRTGATSLASFLRRWF